MSEQTPEPESLDLGSDPAAQMAAIMDFLAPEENSAPGGEGAAAASAASDATGQQPAAPEGTVPAGTDAQPPPAGDAGQPAVEASGQPDPGDAGTVSDGGGSPAGTVDAATLNDKWGELATSFETKQVEHLQNAALAEVREEHKEYFERLSMHPRLLVGQEVQSLTGDGKEVLRDAADAREWQEAAKTLLAEEVQSRTKARTEELRTVFDTVHSSIDLFRSNPDLIPGTKQFDKELAEEFVTLAKSYELRSNGKLVGYSVPVQPMVAQLRTQIASRRQAAAGAAGAASAAAAPHPATNQPRTPTGQWEAPQASLTSKAGQSSGDDGSEAAGVLNAFMRQNGMSI